MFALSGYGSFPVGCPFAGRPSADTLTKKAAVKTATSALQWRSNPVFGESLPKTGIFAVVVGDFPETRLTLGQIGSLETHSRIARARQWRAFLLLVEANLLTVGLLG